MVPLGARSKFMLLHYVGSQRAAKLAARGAELEPAPQSLSIFCELVQKGFSTTFATKLLRVPPMPNETELSITMGASSCCAPASRCCRNQSSGRRNLLNRHAFARADLLLRAKHFVRRCHGDDGWPPRAEASSNLLFGGAGWRHARDNPTQARSAPQPRQAQKTHWQVQCIVRPVLCSRSKLTWLFGSMAAGQGQPASFDFAQPQHASLARAVVSDQPGLRVSLS